MKYDFNKHDKFKKYNDPLIDGFIKWIIFNPNTFITFFIFSLIGITITTSILYDAWSNPFSGSIFILLIIASVVLPLVYFNVSKRGKKLIDTESYYNRSGPMSILYTGKDKTFYQAQYMCSFTDEFEEKD